MPTYTIISGSTRQDSQSAKVAAYLHAQLATGDPAARLEVIDLARVELPQWHEGFWAGHTDDRWTRVAEVLIASDGFVIVAPEWNGMVPPQLMNLFLLSEHGELAHKPALVVGVSATGGGALPVVGLRAFGAKNTQICVMPDHVLVRDARNVLVGPPQSEADRVLRERIAYSLEVFRVYCRAFVAIRASGVIDLESYPYGM